MYYEYYYNFYPDFLNIREKDIYDKHLELRKNIYISKQYIESLHLENSQFFLHLFGNKNKLKLSEYLSKISEEEKFKNCQSYFFIINDHFARNFGHFLPQTFSYNITTDTLIKLKKDVDELVNTKLDH